MKSFLSKIRIQAVILSDVKATHLELHITFASAH